MGLKRLNRFVAFGLCGFLALPLGLVNFQMAKAQDPSKMVSAPYLEKDLAEISRQRLLKLGVPTRMVQDDVGGLTVYRLEVIGKRELAELRKAKDRLLKIGYVFELREAPPANLAVKPAPVKPVDTVAKAPAAKPVPTAPLPTISSAPKGSAPPVLPPMVAASPAPPKTKRVIPFPDRAVGDVLASALELDRDDGTRYATLDGNQEKPSFQPSGEEPSYSRSNDRGNLERVRVDDASVKNEAADSRYSMREMREEPSVVRESPKGEIKIVNAPTLKEEDALACSLARIASDLRRDGLNVSSGEGCAEPVGYLVAEYEDQAEAQEMAKELETEDYKVILVNREDGKVEVRVDDSLTSPTSERVASNSVEREPVEREVPPARNSGNDLLVTSRRLTPEGSLPKRVEVTESPYAEDSESFATLLKEKEIASDLRLESVRTPSRREVPVDIQVERPNPDSRGKALAMLYNQEDSYAAPSFRKEFEPAGGFPSGGSTALDPLIQRLPKDVGTERPINRNPEPFEEDLEDMVIKRRPVFVPSDEGGSRAPAIPNRGPQDIMDLLN